MSCIDWIPINPRLRYFSVKPKLQNMSLNGFKRKNHSCWDDPTAKEDSSGHQQPGSREILIRFTVFVNSTLSHAEVKLPNEKSSD